MSLMWLFLFFCYVLFVCFALIWLNWLCLDYLAVIFTLFDSTWVVFLDRYSAHWAFDWFDLFCLGLLLSDLLVLFCLLVIYFHFVWLKTLVFQFSVDSFAVYPSFSLFVPLFSLRPHHLIIVIGFTYLPDSDLIWFDLICFVFDWFV